MFIDGILTSAVIDEIAMTVGRVMTGGQAFFVFAFCGHRDE